MIISRIVFILAFNPSLTGPTAPLDAYSASDVIADVHARIEASAIPATGGNVETFSGQVLEEEREGACGRLRVEGRPLGVELWAASAPGALGLGSDATVIYYGDHPQAQEAAETVAAAISEIDVGVRLWDVRVEHDPTLPSDCRYIRVGLGNLRGVLGSVAMATEIWRNFIALQIMDGVLAAVTTIEE